MLRSRLLETIGPIGAGFSSSVMVRRRLRRQVHDLIVAAVAPALATLLRDYRVVLASSIVRAPHSDDGDLPLHQDWSFVDETSARSMGVWMPLQDVTTDNGCLRVLPGSHRHRQPLRAVGSGFRYAQFENALLERHLVDLPLNSGEAVLFDHRLIHGSRPNRSLEPRVAVGLVLLPRRVPLHLGRPTENGAPAFADLPDTFLLDEDIASIAQS